MQFPQRTLDPFSIIADNSCNQQTPHGHIRNLNPKPWPLLISLSLPLQNWGHVQELDYMKSTS